MYNYDIFVNSLQELPEGEELKLRVRSLEPGAHKYGYKYVKAMVSASSEEYPEQLQIRFGRGQAHSKPYSIKVLEEMDILSD